MMRWVCLLLAVIPLPSCASRQTDAQPTVIVALSQSIGRGVPKAAQQKFKWIQEQLAAHDLKPVVQPWGIEGEQRLCAVLDAREHAKLIAEIKRVSADVPLLKIHFSETKPVSCDP